MQILNGILNDFHQIDLSDNVKKYEWQEVSLKSAKITPGPRAKHAMVCHNSIIYLFGGIKGPVQGNNEIYSFSIGESMWTRIQPKGVSLPFIDSFGCVLVGDRILITCGYESRKCTLLNSVYQYDIPNNTCTLLFESGLSANLGNK
jgi:N-acetylneuraminic acid mutarotase